MQTTKHRDMMMDNYLKHYSCANGLNNDYKSSTNLIRSNFNASSEDKDEINIKELSVSQANIERARSSMNVSRGVSNSSKKSIVDKKEEMSKRVQKLKSKLNSTKNQNKINMNFKSTTFVQPQWYFSNTAYNNIATHQQNDGSLSPTNVRSGFMSSCGNYQINHSRSSTGLIGTKRPQIIINNQNDAQPVQNFSYYWLNPGVKRNDRNSLEKSRIMQQHQLDGATLIVDRINSKIKKYFNEILIYAEEVHSLNKLSKQELVSFAKQNSRTNHQRYDYNLIIFIKQVI